jgi:hypothetical protein
MSKFKIGFFDLMWFAESIIPPRPIAMSMAFDELSSRHFHEMNIDERKQFFEHVIKCNNFSLDNEQCQHFYARFNPLNQYVVKAFHQAKATNHECYRYNGKYHTQKNVSINEDYITEIIKAT